MQSKLYQLLVDTVKKCQTTTYTDVATHLSLGDVADPNISDEISEMLRIISIQEHDASRPMLTTCVVVRSWSRTRPGSGFYRQMRELGRFDSPSEYDKWFFHIRELWVCWFYWNHVSINPSYTDAMARNDVEQKMIIPMRNAIQNE